MQDQLGLRTAWPGRILRAVESDQLVGGDVHVVENGGATAGLSLSDAVPVVGVDDALAVGGDESCPLRTGIVTGGDPQVVRVETAGAVELLAVEPESVAVDGEGGVVVVGADRLGGQFGRHAAVEDAVGDVREPLPVALLTPQPQPVLGETPMDAQDVWHIRIGLGEPDDQGVQVALGISGAAEFDRQPNRAEPVRADQFQRQFGTATAGLPAPPGILGDLGDDLPQFG